MVDGPVGPWELRDIISSCRKIYIKNQLILTEWVHTALGLAH